MFLKKIIFLTTLIVGMYTMTANAQLKIPPNAYKTLSTPIEMEKPKTVVEIFWFGCPHCNAVRPFVNEWLKNGKPEDVNFEYMPAVTGSPTWNIPARAFFTMKKLNVDLVDAYFDAIHRDQRYPLLGDMATIKAFFIENGVSGDDFDAAWNSQEVVDDMAYARTFFRASEVNGVPNFIVNGKYVVPGNPDKKTLNEIVNTLVELPN